MNNHDIPAIDDLLKEYFAFRGFTATLKQFEIERKADKSKGYQSEKIVEYLFQLLQSHEFQKFTEFWRYLEVKFFAKWSQSYSHSRTLFSNQTNTVNILPENITNLDQNPPSNTQSSAEEDASGEQKLSTTSSTLKKTSYQSESALSGVTSLFDIVRKLEQSLRKYYVVHCIQTKRFDKCKEFFEQYADELARDKDWKDWFSLPFLKNPEQVPELEAYFNKNWSDMLSVSLQNFISTAILSINKPQLLVMESESRNRYHSLKKKVDHYEKENEILRSKLKNAEKHIERLQQQLAQHEDTPRDIHAKANTSPTNVTTSPIIEPHKLSPILQNNSIDDNQSNILNEINLPQSSSQQSLSRPLISNNEPTKQLYPSRIFLAHKGDITNCQFSSEGTYIGTCSSDKTVRIWNVEEIVNTGETTSICFECSSEPVSIEWNKKQDNLLLCGLSNRKVKVLQFGMEMKNKGKLLGDFAALDVNYPRINAIACSPSSRNLCIVASGPTLKPSGTLLSPFSYSLNGGALYGYNLNSLKLECKFQLEPKVPIVSVKFNHNGKMFVTAAVDGLIRIYDINSSSPIMEWEGHKSQATSAYFSHDEASIITTGMDGQIIEWNIHKKGAIVNSLKIPHFGHNKRSVEPRISLFSPHPVSNQNLCRSFLLNDPAILFQKVETSGTVKLVPSYTMMVNAPHKGSKSPSNESRQGVIRFRALDCSPVDHMMIGSGVGNNYIYLYRFPSSSFNYRQPIPPPVKPSAEDTESSASV